MANDAVGRTRLFQEIEHTIPDLESPFDVEAGVQQLRARIAALRELAGSGTAGAVLTSTQNDSDSARGQLGSPEIAGRFASLIAEAENLTAYAADRRAQEMVRSAADRVISPGFRIAVVGTASSGKSSLIATLLDILTSEDPEIDFFEPSGTYLNSPIDQQFVGCEGAILVSAAGQPVTDDERELLRSTINRFGRSVIIARTKVDIFPPGDVTRDAAFRLSAESVLAEGQTLPDIISVSAQAYQIHQDKDSSGIRRLVREIQRLTREWAGTGQRKALHDLARARAHAIEHASHRFDRAEATTREALSTLQLDVSRLATAREDLRAVERTLDYTLDRVIGDARGEVDRNLSALLTELREESATMAILSRSRIDSFLSQAVARMNRLTERSFEQFSATVQSVAVQELVKIERRSGITTLEDPRELVGGPLQRVTAGVVGFTAPTPLFTGAGASLYRAGGIIGGILYGGYEALRTAVTARATLNRLLEEYSNKLRTRFAAAATDVRGAILDEVRRSLGEVLDRGYADYQRRGEELARTRAAIELKRAALDELNTRFDERLHILQDLLNQLA